MDFPFLLLVLLVLPVATAALILGVSAARRRRAATDAPASADAHRFQADTAAVQDAADHPSAGPPEVASGRVRRAASASRPVADRR